MKTLASILGPKKPAKIDKHEPSEKKVKTTNAQADNHSSGKHQARVLQMTDEEALDAIENYENLDELSKKKLADYLDKSKADHQERWYKDPDPKNLTASGKRLNKAYLNSKEFKDGNRTLNNRAKGINLAKSKLAKEEVLDMIENYDQLDELSKKTLGSYIRGAVKDVHKTSASMAATAGSIDKAGSEKWDKSFDKNYKRTRGITAATRRLTKEEVLDMIENYDQLDEVSRATLSRYINKTEDDPKRDSGRKLALKKKWGDKKYGLDEPKVKASESAEDILDMIDNYDQLDELSKKTLGSYVKKASTDARDKGVAVGAASVNRSSNEAKYEWKGSNKRLKGVAKAATKLAKEDVELDQLDEGYAEQQVDYCRRAITQAQTIAQYLERLSEAASESAEYQAGIKDGSIKHGEAVPPRMPYFEAKYLSRQLEDIADSLENTLDEGYPR